MWHKHATPTACVNFPHCVVMVIDWIGGHHICKHYLFRQIPSNHANLFATVSSPSLHPPINFELFGTMPLQIFRNDARAPRPLADHAEEREKHRGFEFNVG